MSKENINDKIYLELSDLKQEKACQNSKTENTVVDFSTVVIIVADILFWHL